MENNEKKNYRKIGVGTGILYFFISALFVTAAVYVSYVAVKTESLALTFMVAIIGIIYCVLMFLCEFSRIGKARKKELAAKKEE